jgi:hypothetical protein
MPKTSEADNKEIIDSIVENYKAFKRSIHTGLMVILGIALILFIFAKSQQEDTPTWVYVIFFAVITGILLRKFLPDLFSKGDAKSGWDKCKSFFLSKNFPIVFWRIVLLILILPFLGFYLYGYFQKREIKYVDTNPPAAQTSVSTQTTTSYASKETMTYYAGERYYLNVPNKETVLVLDPLNTDEVYVTFYHYNTNDVAFKYHIFRSGYKLETKPTYTDGSDWPGQYQFVCDRDIVIQIEK